MFLGLGILICTFVRDSLTFLVGHEITDNIRKETFRKILKMPIFWFERPENNSGILETRLGTDCHTINSMATTYIYIIIQCVSTIVAALVIAFIS